jgi:uncharacterized protein YjbI with pentapeptide repeats
MLFQNIEFADNQLVDRDFTGVTFIDCAFSCSMTDHSWQHATFINCDLRAAKMDNADFTGVTFIDCDLRQAFLWCADLQHATFINCDLRAANIDDISYNIETTFSGCDTRDIDLEFL